MLRKEAECEEPEESGMGREREEREKQVSLDELCPDHDLCSR